MLKALVVFYLRLWWQQMQSRPARNINPDPAHFHRRRFTTKYHRKRGIVKNLWISAGLVMLTYPALPFVVGLSLFMIFLSFLILDETS
ncbi:hypothetical protein FKG94_17840 [Exilibacterium tricleocarpae]|uniref:Uncharacterized protein n=1 Tax=Exilibacterium tricleocarpae TaxID=2591008 RepID=A0A545T8M0_9GAMM|nr:hypothetical protein [Exilibacterium tricleocarpae]TQV73556.1 hypothetical protein FKG94_17840 [Exilibacterium tricleocarpae]